MRPKRKIESPNVVPDDDILPEYDFSGAVRSKYYERYRQDTNVVLLDQHVAEVFRDTAAVNDALRTLVSVAEAKVASLQKRSSMDTKQEILKAIRELPDEANVTNTFRRLLTQYNIPRPTPQWLLEAYYFELFRRDYKLPEGRICYGDKPDVILQGRSKIGIEITNFYLKKGNLPESEQVQSGAREDVVREAQRIYLKSGGKRIELTFSFDKASPILDQEKGRLAKEMAELARRLEGLPTGEIWRKNFKEIPELSYVYLNAKEYDNPKWQVLSGNAVPIMRRDKLLEIVRKKEAKSRDYQRCAAYWLVVVVDYINPAQEQEIPIDGFEEIKSAVFEKVLVYGTAYGHVLEAK